VTDRGWLDAVDVEEAADLTARLVSIRSYPGEEGEVQRAVAGWLEANGLPYRLQPTEGDRPNIIVAIENGAGPTLLLNGHVDTVLRAEGWSSDPWTPRRDGDRLYGLGACDMKSGVAAALLAIRALARRPDSWRGRLLFTSVVDEEAYSVGAHALIDSAHESAEVIGEARCRVIDGAANGRREPIEITPSAGDHPCSAAIGTSLVERKARAQQRELAHAAQGAVAAAGT